MANPGWTRSESPFHAGELAIQARLGIQDRLDRQGRRMIREYLIEQHRQFFTQLSYVIVGTLDPSGQPWASILVGKPGFITSSNERLLQVAAQPLGGDPLVNNLATNIDIGLLGIELSTRRRNRINGTVSAIADASFEVTVKQSFGNCPQYIQARSFEWIEASNMMSHQVKQVSCFQQLERNLIDHADTFFIATAYQDESAGIAKGIDVSHRGGKSGFVRIDEEQSLTFPDFSGNNHFNTLGNIELNPVTGLLFVDFTKGDLLYLTGKAQVIWSGKEIDTYVGAQQLINFQLEKGYLARASLPLGWSSPEFSPFLEQTGSW